MKSEYLLAGLALILLFGCAQTAVSSCGRTDDQFGQYRCYIEKAEAAKDPSVCRLLVYVPWKDECYSRVAAASRDASICPTIAGEGVRDLCYYHIAEFRREPLMCTNIGGARYRDDCYFSIAVSTRNVSNCEHIHHDDRKRWCYVEIAHAVRDAGVCEGIENETYRDVCYQTIAEFTSDPTVCERMSAGAERDYCYEVSLYYVEERDVSICDKIEEESVRESCRSIVSRGDRFHINNDTTACITPLGPRYPGDVWTEQDGSKCSCTRFAIMCYGGVVEIGIGPPNGSPIAVLIPPKGTVEPQPTMPATECDYIGNMADMDLCYEKLARTQRDPSLCDRINDRTFKDLCYSGVAKVEEDPSLCARVEQDIYRRLCLAWFELSSSGSQEAAEWDYQGPLVVRPEAYYSGIKPFCPYGIVDFNGDWIDVCNGDLSELDAGTVVKVKGKTESALRESLECAAGFCEIDYLNVTEFEIFEWNNIEQYCDSANRNPCWNENYTDEQRESCMNEKYPLLDERCEMCPDSIFASIIQLHAKQYCREVNSAAGMVE
ncbi:MAG: hypothetical protein NT157_03935 [Candidatus Micrarchaeota archaeon]|nr:hypothetical protein [Candidatus Micrarchaeota archaeon]